jgi:hypothetical protein
LKQRILASAPVSVFRVGSLMRAPFAYFFAISLLLLAGYEGLHWLVEPPRPISQLASENPGADGKNVAEKSDPPDVTVGTPPQTGSKVSDKIETKDSSDPPASSNRAAADPSPTITSQSKDEPQVPTKMTEDEGCMPIGLTAQGKLVFPMQCQEFLERNRSAGNSDLSTTSASSAPAPTQDQTAEAPKSGGEQTVNRKSTETPASEANAKLEDPPPAGGVESGRENAKAGVKQGSRGGKRKIRNVKPDGMMMIMRTIFPSWPTSHQRRRVSSDVKLIRPSVRTQLG